MSAPATTPAPPATHVYRRPPFFVAKVMNRLVSAAAKWGVSLRGAQVLAVRGRRSGAWHETPVNPLRLGGERYLVAPRGETHWARNLRAAGEGHLRLGRRTEAFRAVELPDAEKLPLLRAYLDRWGAETRAHFGVGKHPTDDELWALAPLHPVFRIEAAPGQGEGAA